MAKDIEPKLKLRHKLLIVNIIKNPSLVKRLRELAAAANEPQNKFDVMETLDALWDGYFSHEIPNPDFELIDKKIKELLRKLEKELILSTCNQIRAYKQAQGPDRIVLSQEVCRKLNQFPSPVPYN